MEPGISRISEGILSAYYPIVQTIHDYVSCVIGQDTDNTKRDILMHETDTLKYRRFLRETVVATIKDHRSNKLIIAPPVGHLREVVEQGQITLLRSKSSTKNILTAGYRLNGMVKSTAGPSLVNYFINTTITAFQSPEWNTIYERLGVDIVFHLLTETSIFIRLPNECLCQITGEPLINLPVPSELPAANPINRPPTEKSVPRHTMKRKAQAVHPDEPAQKRLRPGAALLERQSSTQQPTVQYSPVQINIARLRLFYRRPDRASRTNRITFGFPIRHVLNQLAPPQHGLHAWRQPDARKDAAAARHLSKYIFPRQYGLPNPFEGRQNDNHKPENGDREAQIKALGSCKTPKRLKSTLDLLDKLLWRHSKCRYKPLLNCLCSSKIERDDRKSLDETIILEMMAENSSILISQGRPPHLSSIDSHGRSIMAKGISQAARQVKNKPRFSEFICPYSEVFRFAVAVTKTVIPTAFWGSKHNFKLITNRIKDFIAMRRYETFTLHSILQTFRTSDCEWLMPNTPGSLKQSRVSVSDSLKRLELLQEFLFWYFDSFLIPLIRTNFYVTESGAFRNRVLYFRQDDWDTLCKPLVQRLCTNTFQRLTKEDAEEILRQRRLGFSFVRLLPKETGVRPIVNLKRKKPSGVSEHGQYAQSINQIMSAAFHILTYEKESQKHLLGASVFGQNEIYAKLKEFKTRLSGGSVDGKLPKLYFVKVDVQTCFDTIEQTKLLEILKDVISEDEYSIQRHGQVSSTSGKIRRSFVKTGIPGDDQPHFIRTAHQLASTLRHTIFVDQVLHPSAKRREILQLLEQHITDNIVKIGDSYYRQVVGIPQGSILSSLLCSFFYGDLEKKELKFADDDQSVLMRLIDDYLFVTTDLAQARKFLKVMNRGHPEYGCFISQDKTLTNFEDESMPNIVDLTQNDFPWCGFKIDMTDLSVSIEYSRFHETYLQDSLTVDFGRNPDSSFVQKMLQLAKSKSHIIFTDPALNSTHIIYKNIYENFLVTAMKMHYYLRSRKFDTIKRSTTLFSTIRQMIRYAYSSMRNNATNKVAKASRGQCDVRKATVMWLGVHAFHSVLSCKPLAYQAVLGKLEFDMRLPQYRRAKLRTKKVVKEGREIIGTLSF